MKIQKEKDLPIERNYRIFNRIIYFKAIFILPKYHLIKQFPYYISAKCQQNRNVTSNIFNFVSSTDYQDYSTI